MNFQHPDLKRFLIDSIPGRFSHLSPDEFESFMAHLFEMDGYEVERVPKKGDQAANLLAKKDGSTLAIRILRYPADHLAGEDEIQKALAAKTFYETDQAWVITTSGFSKAAISSAEAEDVEWWDWDALYQALCELFFDGKSHLEYIPSVPAAIGFEERRSDLKLKVKWKPEEGIGTEWYNLDLTISNPTNRNIYIHLDLPALIDTKKNQITAEKWADGEFIAGIVYEGASIRTNALFKSSRIGERPSGGRVMLTCHERTEPPSTYHLAAKLKGEACYFVTYCYSRHSPQYALMVRYRDEILKKTTMGRILIFVYYSLSPCLLLMTRRCYLLERIIRKFTEHKVRHAEALFNKEL